MRSYEILGISLNYFAKRMFSLPVQMRKKGRKRVNLSKPNTSVNVFEYHRYN